MRGILSLPMTRTTYEDAPISVSRRDGWRTMWVEDGTDYPALLAGFRAGQLESAELATPNPRNSIHLVEHGGRRFVVKHRLWHDSIEKSLFRLVAGSYYSRIFKLTWRAAQKGCHVAQEIYLVSELFRGPLVREVWVVVEYVEGASLAEADAAAWRGKAFKALAHLHRCGLSSGDLRLPNLIATPAGEVRLIDVSINSPVPVSQVKDIRNIRNIFGDGPPFRETFLASWPRRLLFGLVQARSRCRETLRGWQGKPRGGRERA